VTCTRCDRGESPRSARAQGRPSLASSLVSATKRVVDRRADLAPYVVVDSSDWASERCLSDCVKTVAVDDRRPAQADLDVVDLDLCGETPDRRGDLGNGNEVANVQYFGSGQ